MKQGQSMEQVQRAYITVDLDAIQSNIRNMQKQMKPGTGMLAVIKADGYGHGSVALAKTLSRMEGIRGFAVATYEEAEELIEAGISLPILILGYTFPYSYETMIRHQIRATVFRKDTLHQLSKAAQSLNLTAKVHIKVDTGMSRIGIRPDESGLEFVKEAFSLPGIEVEGMFTHFARADETDKTGAQKQLAVFEQFLARAETAVGRTIPIKHCSNSAGILEMPDANMDLVRAGIALYGLWPSDEVSRETVHLEPALSFYSHIVYIKEVEAGREISYGGTFTASQSMKVATVPVGYADGYPRGLSNKGRVLIDGQFCPILGRVCMDQFMVDVTQVKGVREGDKVTLVGRDGEHFLSAEELGEVSGRFNYELVCNLNKRVPRIYLQGGKQIFV